MNCRMYIRVLSPMMGQCCDLKEEQKIIEVFRFNLKVLDSLLLVVTSGRGVVLTNPM